MDLVELGNEIERRGFKAKRPRSDGIYFGREGNSQHPELEVCVEYIDGDVRRLCLRVSTPDPTRLKDYSYATDLAKPLSREEVIREFDGYLESTGLNSR